MLIKILDASYYEQLEEILILKAKSGGINKSSNLVVFNPKNYLDKYFTADPNLLCIGLLDNTKLVSAVFLAFSIVKGNPSWIFTNMLTRNFNQVFKWNDNSLTPLIKESFKLAEQRRANTYYYIISSRLSAVYLNKWGKYSDHLRYRHYTEAVIPPNTQPENKFYWNLMSMSTHPIELTINRRELIETVKIDNLNELTDIEKSCNFKDFKKVVT